MMEKEIAIWLSQDAWVGRWTRMRFGYRAWRRWQAAAPRWLLPLSTIQKTRGAER